MGANCGKTNNNSARTTAYLTNPLSSQTTFTNEKTTTSF